MHTGFRFELIEHCFYVLSGGGAEQTALYEYAAFLLDVVFSKGIHIDKLPQLCIGVELISFVKHIFGNVAECMLRDKIEIINMFSEKRDVFGRADAGTFKQMRKE